MGAREDEVGNAVSTELKKQAHVFEIVTPGIACV
jgi:hypothetical protein